MTLETTLLLVLVIALIIGIACCSYSFIKSMKLWRDETLFFLKMVALISEAYKETFGENSISEVSVLLDNLKNHYANLVENGKQTVG